MRNTIERVLDTIRPALESHGGDITLVKIVKRSKTAYIRFQGTCDHCAISEVTLKFLVEREIRAACPEIIKVVSV